MPNIAVSIEKLGKVFKRSTTKSYSRLSEKLAGVLKNPLTAFQRRPAVEPFWALKDLSFDVEEGSVLGLIGRNGAGKSTLLKILSRITDPTEGQATIKGRLGSILEVGVGFHPELTGRENIFLNGQILGMKKNEILSKFDEIVQFAEVEGFLDTQIKRYSSGMYVRLAFAVAAHLEPDVLIVDEVLAVGDAAFQKKCLGKLNQISKEQGRTVLFVSHDMAAVNSLCTKVVMLERGRLAAIGAPADIVSQYMNCVFRYDDQDIDDLRIRGYGLETHFTDIQLDCDNSALKFGDPIKITTIVEGGPVTVSGLTISITIVSRSGAPVMTAFSREVFSIAPNERVLVQLTLPNTRLVPGQYYATCSLGRGGYDEPRYNIDIIEGRPIFQILPISADNDLLFNWQTQYWGSVAQMEVVSTVSKIEDTLLLHGAE